MQEQQMKSEQVADSQADSANRDVNAMKAETLAQSPTAPGIRPTPPIISGAKAVGLS